MILYEPCPDPPADVSIGQGKRKPDSSQGFRFPTPEKRGFETKRAYYKPKTMEQYPIPGDFCRDQVGDRHPTPGDFSPDREGGT